MGTIPLKYWLMPFDEKRAKIRKRELRLIDEFMKSSKPCDQNFDDDPSEMIVRGPCRMNGRNTFRGKSYCNYHLTLKRNPRVIRRARAKLAMSMKGAKE